MPLLDVKNLSVSFETYMGKVKAIQDVSFTIERGETVAIVGESGCGKSVTAQSIMRLIQTPPGKIENGAIFFENENLLIKSAKEMDAIRGKEIGMIFQDPMTALNPTMRVGKQIREALVKHKGLTQAQAKKEALEMLALVGIPDPEERFEQFPHEFSGGMRQRAMIAIALSCSPKLLIADEPTTALDVTIQAQILDLMKELQKKMQTSIILITHDLGIVAGMCDRVLVMYGGQIVEKASVEKLYRDPLHPYTQGLLRSVPRLDRDKNKELVAIEGAPPNLLFPPSGCMFHKRCSFAMRICQKERPKMTQSANEHEVRCWLEEKKCRH